MTAVDLSIYDPSSGKVKRIYNLGKNPRIFANTKLERLREIIAIVTGIPVFRQHLFLDESNDKANPNGDAVGYHIVSDVFVNTNISAHPTTELVAGVPVDMNCYRHRDNIHVVIDDPYTTIDAIFGHREKHQLYLVDLADYITGVAQQITDRYQLEVIYYAFIIKFWPILNTASFADYVYDIPDFYEKYPNLAIKKEKYELSEKLYLSLDDTTKKKEFKEWAASVTATISKIKFETQYDLEDLFQLFNDTIPHTDEMVIYKTMVDGVVRRVIKINEHHTNVLDMLDTAKNMHRFPRDFVAVIRRDGVQTMVTFITATGFSHRITWNVGTDIRLDELSRDVVNYVHRRFPLLRMHSYKVVDLIVNVSWPGGISGEDMNRIRENLVDDVNAGFIARMAGTPDIYEYRLQSYRTGAMPDIVNMYDYLTEASAEKLIYEEYVASPVIQFTTGITQPKQVVISNVSKRDYHTIVSYVITRVFVSRGENTEDVTVKRTNRLKVLKSVDPVLYDYKSPPLYSRYCQRPHQPHIYTKKEFDRMPADKKKILTKYKNVTTGEDVWYECPNPKFSKFGFIVDKHPEGYCVPCCKKVEHHTAITAEYVNKRDVMYETCMSCGKYRGEYMQTKTSYVFNFGKPLDPGRVGFLPEHLTRYLRANIPDTEKERDIVRFEGGAYSFKKLRKLAGQSKKVIVSATPEILSAGIPGSNVTIKDLIEGSQKYKNIILKIRATPDEDVVVAKGKIIFGVTSVAKMLLEESSKQKPALQFKAVVIDDTKLAKTVVRSRERSRYDTSYYLLGVQQNTKNVAAAGVLCCISVAMRKPISEIIAEFRSAISAANPAIAVGLAGIPKADLLHELDKIDGSDDIPTVEVDWNDVFVRLAEMSGYGIYILSTHDGYKLRAPVGDGAENHGRKNICLLSRKRHADIFEDDNVYDLICFMDPRAYFSRKTIIRSNFDDDEDVVKCLDMLRSRSRSRESTDSVDASSLPKPTYDIIDSKGMRYAVKYSNGIVFPVTIGHPTENVHLGHTRKTGVSCSEVVQFMRRHASVIRIKKLIVLNGMVIGFDLGYGYVYFSPTKPHEAVKIAKDVLPEDDGQMKLVWNILYDPDDVNREIVKTPVSRDYDGAFSRSFRYYLFMENLFAELRKERNTSARKKLSKFFASRKPDDPKLRNDYTILAEELGDKHDVEALLVLLDDVLAAGPTPATFDAILEERRFHFDDTTINEWKAILDDKSDHRAALLKSFKGSGIGAADAELLADDLVNLKKRELVLNYSMYEDIQRYVPITQHDEELVFIK